MDGNTEKYGIELELLITKFKNKAEQVKKDIKSLGEQAKANIGDLDVDINIKTLDKDISIAKSQIQSLKDEMSEYQKYGYTTSPFYQELSKDLDVATQKLKKLEQAQQDVNDEMNESSTISAKSTFKISSGFDGLLKKVSRYALSLFSLSTIYSLVSRASSAYLSQDTELANKLQSAWVGLGAILAPVLEKMADLVIKIVGYVNVFVQALTGVNYIAKASAKYMNSLSKSTKEANKQLASFDELNNLSEYTGTSSGASSSNPFAAFDNVQLDDGIVKQLQDLAYWLKENWNWIKLVGEVLLATFAISKLSGIISNIGKVTSSLGSKGLFGAIQNIVGLGAIAVTFYIAGSIMQDINQIKQDCESIRQNSEGARQAWLDSEPALEDLYGTMNANNGAALDALEQSAQFWNIIFGFSDEYLANAEQVVVNSQQNLTYLQEQYNQGKLNDEQQLTLLDKLKEQLDVNSQIIEKLEENGMDTSEIVGINKEYADFTRKVYENLIQQGISQDEVLNLTGLTKDEIQRIYDMTNNNTAVMKLDVDTSKAETNSGNFFSKLGQSFSALFEGDTWSNGLINTLKGIWSFDVGTNYVPSDNLAMVHKGEAIIPKKFNNKEFFSNMGNSETNELLVEVLNAINNIDFKPYTTVKDVGEASVKYINEKSRYQGKSVIK